MSGGEQASAVVPGSSTDMREPEGAWEDLRHDLRSHQFPNRGVQRALRTSRALCGASGAALFVLGEGGRLRLLVAQGGVPPADRMRFPGEESKLAGGGAFQWSAASPQPARAHAAVTKAEAGASPAAVPAALRASGGLGAEVAPGDTPPTAALVLYFAAASEGAPGLAAQLTPCLRARAERVLETWREAWVRVERDGAAARDERRRLRALAKASRLFACAGRTLDDVLQAVVSETCRQVGDTCSLYLLGDDPGLLRLVACEHRLADGAAHPTPPPFDVRHLADDEIFAACLRGGETLFQPLVAPNMLRHVRISPFDDYVARFGVSGLIMVPLRAHGTNLGVLLVTRMRGGPRYTAEDRLFLDSLADHAALAIENARAFSALEAAHARALEAQRWLQRRQSLREALQAGTSAEAVTHTLLQAGARYLGASSAGLIVQVGRGGWRWERASGSGIAAFPEALHAAIEDEIASREAEHLPFVVIPATGGVDASGATPHPPACTLVPLATSVQGRRWLCFGHPRPPARDEARTAFVEALGQQGGASLERALLWEQLQASEAEARRLSSFQAELMGIVGHDLRNPLAAIRMGAALMQRLLVGQERPSLIAERIIASAERGDRLIRDLLDLSCARLGAKLPVHKEPTDLRAVVRGVVTELEAAHPGRDISVASEGETTGTWDGSRLSQVFSNLLGNALAYSPPRSPVSLRLRGDASRVEVVCHNRGEPIPAAALPYLFEPFRGANAEGPKGRGLGLYIVRELVQAHGGWVEVTSCASEGTRFRVVLPRDGPGGSGAAPGAEQANAEFGPGPPREVAREGLVLRQAPQRPSPRRPSSQRPAVQPAEPLPRAGRA